MTNVVIVRIEKDSPFPGAVTLTEASGIKCWGWNAKQAITHIKKWKR
jgi:hypothetical protein